MSPWVRDVPPVSRYFHMFLRIYLNRAVRTCDPQNRADDCAGKRVKVQTLNHRRGGSSPRLYTTALITWARDVTEANETRERKN